MDNAMAELVKKGAKVSASAPLATIDELTLKYGLKTNNPLICMPTLLGISRCVLTAIVHGVRKNFESFMKLFQEANLQTLEDLKLFNDTHADLELPPGNSMN